MTVSELNNNMFRTIGVGDIVEHNEEDHSMLLVTVMNHSAAEFTGVIIYPGRNVKIGSTMTAKLYKYHKYLGKITLYND